MCLKACLRNIFTEPCPQCEEEQREEDTFQNDFYAICQDDPRNAPNHEYATDREYAEYTGEAS